MIVVCPSCNISQVAPDDSEGKRARCKACRETFVILDPKSPIVVPDIPAAEPDQNTGKPNFITRSWSRIPAPFKFSFLATLGVVSALLFAWYAIRLPKILHKPATYTPAAQTTTPASVPVPAAQAGYSARSFFAVQIASMAGRYATATRLAVLYADLTIGYRYNDRPTVRLAHLRNTVPDARKNSRPNMEAGFDAAVYVNDIALDARWMSEELSKMTAPDMAGQKIADRFQKAAESQADLFDALYKNLIFDDSYDAAELYSLVNADREFAAVILLEVARYLDQ